MKCIPRDSRITEGVTERGEWRMWNCDVLEALRCMHSNHFHCIVTSPPYWMKRRYGVIGELGLEKTLAGHVAKLVEVCAELKRVLRPDGVLCFNYQDGYAQNGQHADDEELAKDQQRAEDKDYPTDAYSGKSSWQRAAGTAKGSGLKVKQMLLIPERLALALQADGWWIRQRVTWYKPNARPDSCTDRPSQYDEVIFFLTKTPRNYYDRYSCRETRLGENWGRQMGNVWAINSEPCPYPHASTFPAEIPRRCIQLCTSAGVDRKGDPVKPVYEVEFSSDYSKACGGAADGSYVGANTKDYSKLGAQSPAEIKRNTLLSMMPRRLTGHESGLYGQCRVLDPFAGVGTTGMEALKLGRSFTGVELHPESYAIACQRMKAFEAGITGHDITNGQLPLWELGLEA